MHLIFPQNTRPLPNSNRLNPPKSDAQIATLVADKKTAAEAQLASLTTELQAACAQAEREAWDLGTPIQQNGLIDRLVQQITVVEGAIAYLTAAVAGLPAPE